MKTVIVGAGGVGLALASCLHAAGHALHFVVRDAADPHPIEVDGITRRGLLGTRSVPPGAVRVSRALQDLAGTAPDHLIVCTKTTAIPELAASLGAVWPTLGSEPIVVLCQNGWGSAERFAAHVPRDCVFNARVITGFSRRSASEVDITVHADAIHLGSLFGESADRLQALAEAIDRGGIPCRTSTTIEADLLGKLLYNCLLNPLGALVGVAYGELGKAPETRHIMESLAGEIFRVLDGAGLRTHWFDAEEYLEHFHRRLLPATALHRSSMLQDLTAGRPTEIDALNGAVLRMGAAHDVATPVNAALTRLIHAAETRGLRRPEDWQEEQPEERSLDGRAG